ncbi:MAG: hypothetical protein GXP61_04460 [Epsilonproteobacteria bacterium]|nr:hypothetical protein [Campylobacterota bacterium]
MNHIFYFFYSISSKIPDKLVFGFWFKFITKLRAKILNLMPNMSIGKKVKIYKNMKTTKKSKLNIGENSTIKENCTLIGNIEIGENCNILNNTKIDGSGRVIIGNNSHIGRENDIFSHYHDISKKETLVNKSKEIFQTTIIGENVMLFSKVGIMGGLNIENGVVVGYGSVVTKNCEKNGIYVGVPAKKIGQRE